MTVVLDSGAVSALADGGPRAARRIAWLRSRGIWPPAVPTAVLVESLTGAGPRDARVSRLLRLCEVVDLGEPLARRAAALRSAAGVGSAVDAVVVATAEAVAGPVLTGDLADIRALTAHARGVAAVAV